MVFDEIDPEPLGAASLAQVHKARLKDGTLVAVKVQHPYVQGNSLVDMKTMEVSVSHIFYLLVIKVTHGYLLLSSKLICPCFYSIVTETVSFHFYLKHQASRMVNMI